MALCPPLGAVLVWAGSTGVDPVEGGAAGRAVVGAGVMVGVWGAGAGVGVGVVGVSRGVAEVGTASAGVAAEVVL